MIHYSQCPICSSPKIALSLSAKDFTVTKEIFPIWKCTNCSLQFTQDVPEQSAIGKFSLVTVKSFADNDKAIFGLLQIGHWE